MLLQRTNPQSVETFPIMPRNAFKAPKTKRSPAKQETELYASSSKKRRTKDDFYTFCTIVLSYTQYESIKREELRQQNNISPVGSGGSAADSYSSDSTASLSSSSLQECLQDSLQDGSPVDRVQQPSQDTALTAISSSNQINERVTALQPTPKLPQQTVKPAQQPLQQQSKQPNLKQSPLSKNQLSVYDVKHKQLKPQQQPKQSQPQQISPKHQQPQIKQELSIPAQSSPLAVTPTSSSTTMTPLHHPSSTSNRVESKISPKVIKLEPSTTYSLQEQLSEDKKPNRFELLQRPKPEENNLSAAGKQKIIIKKEMVENEEIMKDKENEISKISSQERRVNAVRKANLRYSKLEMNSSHENAESNTDSCADSIHSNCSSSPDVNETDEESWDLITCHCLKPYAGRPMIECSECSTWIHLSCAKIRKSNIPETFVCQQCREAKFTTRKSNRIRTESKRISI